MKALALEQLQQLAATLTVLRGRVREAVAGEVGKAVAEAVSEVITAGLGGRLVRYASRVSAPYRSSGYGRSDWEDPEAQYWAEGYSPCREPQEEDEPPAKSPTPEAALAVALTAGRWWLARHGSSWGAAGVGLAAGVALLTGGPLARTTLGALWAIQRLVAATDALGDGAKALDRM